MVMIMITVTALIIFKKYSLPCEAKKEKKNVICKDALLGDK